MIPESILPFWTAFESATGLHDSSRFYEAFHFADSEDVANKLAELVIAGTKRATAGLLWSYEHDADPLPMPGNLSVVTTYDGTPRCVIKTTGVVIVPFEEIPEDFALTEGEGDKSLRYWREAHWEYFARECTRVGRDPSPKMPVVCERFEVVYAPESPGHRL